MVGEPQLPNLHIGIGGTVGDDNAVNPRFRIVAEAALSVGVLSPCAARRVPGAA